MTVSWDPPVEPNGKIVGYEVIYYEKDNQVKKIANVSGQRYTIENLKPFRIYGISMACISSGGTGRYSVAIENQTLPGGESFTCIIVCFVQSAQQKRTWECRNKIPSHYYDSIKTETVLPLDPQNIYACVLCYNKSHL